MLVDLSPREVELITDGLGELHDLIRLSRERPANRGQHEKYSLELHEIGELFDKLQGIFD